MAYQWNARVILSGYRIITDCSPCSGSRVAYTGYSISDVYRKGIKVQLFPNATGIKCPYFSFLEKHVFSNGTNPSHKKLKSEVSNL